MGMFDYIVCEYRSTEFILDDKDNDYQTKDLDCMLDTYILTRDGQLKREKFDLIDVLVEQENGLVIPEKHRAAEPSGYEAINDYTGSLTFYNLTYEYVATLMNGKIITFKRVRP